MSFAMQVTVWLEISGISKDELRLPEISIHTVTRMAKFIYRYTRDLQPDRNPHGEVHLLICARSPRTSPCVLLCGWRSQVYLGMNFAMGVAVWLEISGISIDELRHAGYCGVGDLMYI
jgi:hypothetical protein